MFDIYIKGTTALISQIANLNLPFDQIHKRKSFETLLTQAYPICNLAFMIS